MDELKNLGNKEIMAANIKKYMRRKGVNAAQVCADLGIKKNTFSCWVNATAYPRIDKIELLANYFLVKKSDLVENKEEQSNIPEYNPRIHDFIDILPHLTNEQIDSLLQTAQVFASMNGGQ